MRDETCIFCQIVSGERPADVIYQNDTLIAFHDIRPAAPVHVLVVPRKHIRSTNDLTEDDRQIVADMLFQSRKIAEKVGIDKSGYKLVFNTERGAGQVIFHLHMHLIGGWPDGWRRT
jgi:histidine triad (HIT) family protein